MRALVFLVQLLFWLLVVRLVLRGLVRLAGIGARRSPGGIARPEANPGGEDLVLDRVCGSHLPRSRALAVRVQGREEHFCSEACRDKALAALAHAS